MKLPEPCKVWVWVWLCLQLDDLRLFWSLFLGIYLGISGILAAIAGWIKTSDVHVIPWNRFWHVLIILENSCKVAVNIFFLLPDNLFLKMTNFSRVFCILKDLWKFRSWCFGSLLWSSVRMAGWSLNTWYFQTELTTPTAFMSFRGS